MKILKNKNLQLVFLPQNGVLLATLEPTHPFKTKQRKKLLHVVGN